MRAIFIFISLIIFTNNQILPDWSARLKEKITKAVKHTYQVEDFKLIEIIIGEGLENRTKSNLSESLFSVESNSESKGFIYVSKAASMKNVFDYIVLFDNDYKIIKTKVLIYREQHGRQIGARRWLKQFDGMTANDSPKLGVEIDGISGATISATNMTNAIRELLSSVSLLQASEITHE